MRNVMIALMLLLGMQLSAQSEMPSPHKHREGKENFSPEQKAELLSKKLTLALDLSKRQQVQAKALLLEQATERLKWQQDRKARMSSEHSMSTEERFALKNERLDRAIAVQNSWKEILSEAQYDKFRSLKKGKRSRMHRRGRR